MSDERTRKREINGLLTAAKATACRNLCIITPDKEDFIQQEEITIKVVPAWKWLLGK